MHLLPQTQGPSLYSILPVHVSRCPCLSRHPVLFLPPSLAFLSAKLHASIFLHLLSLHSHRPYPSGCCWEPLGCRERPSKGWAGSPSHQGWERWGGSGLAPGCPEARANSWSEAVLWRHLLVLWDYSRLAAARTCAGFSGHF